MFSWSEFFLAMLSIIIRYTSINKNNTILDQYRASIFSFNDMRNSNYSLKHPFTYAKHLIQLLLKLESLDGTDLKDFHAKTKLSLDRLEESLKNKNNDINESTEKNITSSLASFIDQTNARHVLIASTWRSGSTFLGDLLSRYPGVFYSFEPLHYYDPDYGAFQDNRTIDFEKK